MPSPPVFRELRPTLPPRILQITGPNCLEVRGETRLSVTGVNDPEATEVSQSGGDHERSASLRRSFRAWQRVVVGLLLLLLVAGGVLYATVIRQGEDVRAVRSGVKKVQESIEQQLAGIRPDDVKKQLRNTIEETYEKDLQEAEKLPDWKKREEAKKDARELKDKRLGQVEEFLNSITSSIKSGEATPELLEFTRILQDQGPAEAVKYIDGQEQRLLADAEKLTQKKRRTLQPLLEAAKVHFNRGEWTQAREKCEKLLAQDGDWPEALSQHALVMQELGNRALKYDKTENAQLYFQAQEKSARRRWELDPEDARKQRDLAVSFERLGYVCVALGRTEDALKYYDDGLKIGRQLADADPKHAQKQRDLVACFYKRGCARAAVGDYEAAIDEFQRGVTVLDRLIEAKLLVESSGKDKANLQHNITFCQYAIVATGEWEALLKSDTKQLPELLSVRATELANRGRLNDVEQTAAKLREYKPASDATLYDSGCAYGLCAALAVKGKTKPTEDDLKLKKKYTDLALACLKDAIAAGFKDYDHMKQDSDLAALRDLQEFRALFPKE
jgi:tetratricopeptide (TPR) repeat protein